MEPPVLQIIEGQAVYLNYDYPRAWTCAAWTFFNLLYLSTKTFCLGTAHAGPNWFYFILLYLYDKVHFQDSNSGD